MDGLEGGLVAKPALWESSGCKWRQGHYTGRAGESSTSPGLKGEMTLFVVHLQIPEQLVWREASFVGGVVSVSMSCTFPGVH